jgi:Ala-tRNA(Pro) deacylase
VLDLKTVHTQIGAQTRLNFASGDLMLERLGVPPGALTPLAMINDAEGTVTVVIDSTLLEAEQINVHPLINIESTGLRPADLLTFIRSCEREPVLVAFDAPQL